MIAVRSMLIAKRLAHARIVEGRLGCVDRVVIDAEIGRDPGLVRQVLVQPVDLLGGEVGLNVDLAGAELLGRGVPFLRRVPNDPVDRDVVGIIEGLVLDGRHMGVRHPLLEHIGAVADEVAGLDPVIAMFLDLVLGHGIGGLMGQLLQEIGSREIRA